ncbi:leucine-rich repeat-containing protein 14 [Platysternon megacephalum]|uniref:Leucine-rich repeat-containing protein 14 n=1 Tax=Platysternon megacephalum TaxID=55544 RepID=A0A4D9DVJ3_9SAUR|nr:leucine-rich repeat-containing protein 14 [Platysternon megacephalum]
MAETKGFIVRRVSYLDVGSPSCTVLSPSHQKAFEKSSIIPTVMLQMDNQSTIPNPEADRKGSAGHPRLVDVVWVIRGLPTYRHGMTASIERTVHHNDKYI